VQIEEPEGVAKDEFWNSGDMKLPGHDGHDIGCMVANASILLRTLSPDDVPDTAKVPAAVMMKNVNIKICGGILLT